MSKPILKKPAKPIREVKARVSNPNLDFAVMAKMITDQEHAEFLKGNVSFYDGNKMLMNLNADLPNFPTGTKQRLYPNRGIIKTAKDFLDFTG
jgi:hypothetical protein